MKNTNIPPDLGFNIHSFHSDGCTMCGVCKKLLGGDRYEEACREHDFLRRFGIIHWFKANLLLSKRIFSHGLIGKIRAPLYLIATTITYSLYKETQDLPEEWEEYAEHYR